MVSLDIEGAFDNAWWPALKAQLLAYNCPVNLYGMAPAGPTFWNLILTPYSENSGNSAYTFRRLRMMWSPCSPQSASSIEEEANHAQLACTAGESEVEVRAIETNSMVLTKLKYDDPVVHMNGEQISLLAKYASSV
ncbi:hypothetical protein EVAR_90463_1 [Eumeta japonica]|uniref:Reverse transcriptase domain-containing protein n=1 Tax=Eumeta variegata TaxID=151549 RepID=A0A4C1SI42_EUMVA|nr:hypothetical protein EVAR_90463_1 [Eumeta japonica]